MTLKAKRYDPRLDAILDRVKGTGGSLADLSDHANWANCAEDLYFNYAMALGETGCLLDLAVGQQLGPHPFRRGTR